MMLQQQANVLIKKDLPIIFDGLHYEAKDFDEIPTRADGNCFWHCAKYIFDSRNDLPKYRDCGRVKSHVINHVVDIVKGY